MKKTILLLSLAILCTVSTNCNSDSDEHPLPVGLPAYPKNYEKAEVLRGLLLNSEGLTIQVDSNGCTKKEDFELREFQSFPSQLQIIRKVQDTCEAHLPYGINIEFTYEELGLTEPGSMVINNQINIRSFPKN